MRTLGANFVTSLLSQLQPEIHMKIILRCTWIIIIMMMVASCASTATSNPPGAPSNLEATLDDGNVLISWQDNSDNETAFIIQWAVFGESNPGDLRNITSYGENITSWKQHPDAECNTTYQYVVQAASRREDNTQFKNSDPVCVQATLTCDGEQREISSAPCEEGGFWDYFSGKLASES
jgi:hypothetical protein